MMFFVFSSSANMTMEHISKTYANIDELFLKNHKNASSKLAFFADNQTVSELNKICQCSSLLLPETLMTKPIGLAVDKNHFLFDLIEDTLQRILAAGIPQHSSEFHKWVLYRRNTASSNSDSKPFTLKDVDIAFNLWFITCGISIFVFVCEFVWVKMKILSFHMREFLGLVLFFALLHRRLNIFY
jgi:hypothetical protein